MDIHYLALAGSVALTAFAHISLKIGATRADTTGLTLRHPFTLVGYAMFIVVTLLTVFAMQTLTLSVVTAWTGLTYILTTLGAAIFLGERVSQRGYGAVTMMAFGMVVFYL